MDVKINNPMDAKKFFEAKVSFTTGPVETDHLRKENSDRITLIDVRAREDYEKEHLPGAIHLTREAWKNPPKGLAKEKLNIVYCYSIVCHLAAKACVELADQGYPVMEMDGGFKSWKEHRLETEKGEGLPRVQESEEAGVYH